MLFARTGLRGLTEDLATISSRGPAVISEIATVLRQIGPYTDTLVRIVNDPALPQFMQRIEAIDALEPSTSTGGPSTPAASDKSGVGLKSFVPLLDAYIFVKKNPFVPWLVGAGFVFLLGGIGYRLGQSRAVR